MCLYSESRAIFSNSLHLRISCSSLPKSCKDPFELSSSLPDSLALLWLDALLLECSLLAEFRFSSAISPVVHPAHAEIGKKKSEAQGRISFSLSPTAGFCDSRSMKLYNGGDHTKIFTRLPSCKLTNAMENSPC